MNAPLLSFSLTGKIAGSCWFQDIYFSASVTNTTTTIIAILHNTMLLYHVITICAMIGYLSSSALRCSDQITVRCLSCQENSDSRYFEARPGSNLTLKYDIDNTNFRILTIKYNGTNNRLEVCKYDNDFS